MIRLKMNLNKVTEDRQNDLDETCERCFKYVNILLILFMRCLLKAGLLMFVEPENCLNSAHNDSFIV